MTSLSRLVHEGSTILANEMETMQAREVMIDLQRVLSFENAPIIPTIAHKQVAMVATRATVESVHASSCMRELVAARLGKIHSYINLLAPLKEEIAKCAFADNKLFITFTNAGYMDYVRNLVESCRRNGIN